MLGFFESAVAKAVHIFALKNSRGSTTKFDLVICGS